MPEKVHPRIAAIQCQENVFAQPAVWGSTLLTARRPPSNSQLKTTERPMRGYKDGFTQSGISDAFALLCEGGTKSGDKYVMWNVTKITSNLLGHLPDSLMKAQATQRSTMLLCLRLVPYPPSTAAWGMKDGQHHTGGSQISHARSSPPSAASPSHIRILSQNTTASATLHGLPSHNRMEPKKGTIGFLFLLS